MNTPNIRALCRDLADHLQARVNKEDQEIPARGYLSQSQQLIGRARVALAQPEGEGPSDEDMDLAVIAIQALAPHQPDATTHDLASVDRGREILRQSLACWGRPAAPPALPEGEGPILQWTHDKPPCEKCRYDHCTAETPFGRFLISWKSWKEFDSPTVDETPWGDWYGAFDSVDAAKAACQREMDERLARWSRPPAPPAPEAGEAWELVDRLNQVAGDFDFLCNKIVNGECRTLACLQRGGYIRGTGSPDSSVATCPELENAGAMRRAATLLSQLSAPAPPAPPAQEVGAALADLENLELAFESSFECKVRTSRIRPALLHYATLLQQQAAPAPAVVSVADDRDPECVARWPECAPGDYDPRCCRFPKSCSCASAIPLPQAGEGE